MTDDFSFKVNKDRPEDIYERVMDYFNPERIKQYTLSKTMHRIQTKITVRALELLELRRKDSLLLDAGCGPGFASFFLREMGYQIVAFDLISQFLSYYEMGRVNPLIADMCKAPFKPKIFDGIISISALQWVYRDPLNKKMEKNFIALITTFYQILKHNSTIVFQFYPKNSQIISKMKELINLYTDFEGEFVIDMPNNPKKRKIFLVLEKQ
jgi:18S rRNA (guanine1575-N7)-methyltransferase